MPGKSVAIIGAGVAGLAAGCYAQLNGLRSEIFELHDIPGGLCTSWERKGYLFDGSIRYLYGSGAGLPFNQLWQELGVLDGLEFVHHDEFMRVVDSAGQTLVAYTDPDRLEAHLKELAPEDERVVTWFADSVRRFRQFDLARIYQEPRRLMSGLDGLDLARDMISYAPDLARWGLMSAADFGERFTNPFLRRAVPLMFGWRDIPMVGGLAQLAYMNVGNAGYPLGGSLAFARRLEQRYLELGGTIHSQAQVATVNVEGDRAVGVTLYDDETHRAGFVIAACDGRGTVERLLAGRYSDRTLRALYDGHLPILSQLQVSLGVSRDLRDTPHFTTLLLDDPVLVGDQPRTEISYQHYCYDPSAAPPGKSVMVTLLPSDYGFWQRIYGRRPYRKEQTQVGEQLLDIYETVLPGLRAQVEVLDVATPVSFERYTGNWLGATTGWLLTSQTLPLMLKGVSQTLPGLGNLYMAGQWVEPGGGVPMVAMSGRKAIQLVCDEVGQSFVTRSS